MTQQINLGLVWASAGGVTDPGNSKYSQGWVSEIPTYQNFNFVLQNATRNLLALAERGAYDWESGIRYEAGTVTRHTGLSWYATADSTGQVPGLGSSWSNMPSYADSTGVLKRHADYGLHIGVTEGSDNTSWSKNALTLLGNWSSSLTLGTASALYDNITIANTRGILVAKVTSGPNAVPDGTSLDPEAFGGSYRIFHEGQPPKQEDVEGTIPDAPGDGRIYGRIANNWAEVAVTTYVGIHPPAPSEGTGSLWFNLGDARLYIDLDDGSSTQWAPASPTYTLDASNHKVDTTGMTTEEKLDAVGLTVEELQYALGIT